MNRSMFPPIALVALAVALAIPTRASAQTEPPDGDEHALNLFFTSEMINPCNGELVTVTGNIDLLIHTTVDRADALHIKIHENSKGRGVGVTFTEYIFSDEFDSEAYLPLDAHTVTLTETREHLLTSNDPSENFAMKVTEHITIVDQVPTAEVSKVTCECRGGAEPPREFSCVPPAPSPR